MSKLALIILRLIPTQAISPDDFTSWISELTITAYDLTVQNSVGGSVAGTATSNTPQTPPVGTLDPTIFQDVSKTTLKPMSTATAVFSVDPKILYFDLRFAITRGKNEIVDSIVEYNLKPRLVSFLDPNQSVYMEMKPHAYLRLPPPTDPSVPAIPSSSNGQPPKFEDVVTSVNQVLVSDHSDSHSTLDVLENPLTIGQCNQIAADISWNRSSSPLPTADGGVASLYTLGFPGVSKTDQDNSRSQFEGQLSSYYSSFNSTTSVLSNFIFAASAAVCCERQTSQATLAGLTFPVVTGPSANDASSTASVVVVSVPENGNVSPPWTVPAPYFYILGANLPSQILFPQRYQTALSMTENQLLTVFNAAVDSGTLPASVTPFLGGDQVTPAQAARRLVALGSTSGAPQIQQATISNLIFIPATAGSAATADKPVVSGTPASGWLAYTGSDINVFWTCAIKDFPEAYLTLLLQAITQGETDLVTALSTSTLLQITTVDELVKATDDNWTTFFESNSGLLPPFTLPGGVQQRITSFIQHLRRVIPAPAQPSTDSSVSESLQTSSGTSATASTPPRFGLPSNDALSQFITQYQPSSGSLDFGKPFDVAAFDLALTNIFPKNPESQDWLRQALTILQTLVILTSTCDSKLQFSLIESLYARGFTTTKSVNVLTLEEFKNALTGTIAYQHADTIRTQSQAMEPLTIQPLSQSGFVPVNPDGSLTNSIPPVNLSPLGSVQYLHEILALKFGDSTLESCVTHRRGAIGKLHTTMENINTPVPCIDLINESLEYLGSHPTTGSSIVYDTTKSSKEHLAAVPEYSSPATPVNQATIYDTLKQCFTAPGLPYPQALDICRSYLGSVGTNRFETMRHFRKDITELAIDATLEPTDFQGHLWRLPVRFELALEYLHLSNEEYEHLFNNKLPDIDILQVLGVDESTVLTVPGFLKFTGLNYNQFLDLERCDYVPFTRDVGHFPQYEPPCLKELRISFGVTGESLNFELHKLFVFIRLWRQVSNIRGPSFTFNQLADICNVLELFTDKAVNGDFIRQFAALLMLQNQFNLPWTPLKTENKASGVKRTQLLALWVQPDVNPVEWHWALKSLLEQVEKYAKARYASSSGFTRDIRDRIHDLSLLAGFTNQDTWHSKPTSTLRFTEVLSKLCASDFTVGEIIFLFTAETPQVPGEDPYNISDPLESLLDPLNIPEDSQFGLWSLRDKLLEAEITDAEEWTWHRIESALQYITPHIHEGDLRSLAEHFFPCAVERHGHHVKCESRQFRVKLQTRNPLSWNTGEGPFRYDSGTEELWLQLPVSDEEVVKKLRLIPQLTNEEICAVQNLYFAPRATLSRFALFFSDFRSAVHKLVNEPDEEHRFRFFQREFALFHRRCEIIAQHLAAHVAFVTHRERPESHTVAWQVLRSLLADENRPSQDWENDAGTPPNAFMWDRLSGSAFAALLGLCGTGLLEEFHGNSEVIWRNVTDELTFFGPTENKANTPIPTLIPSPCLTLTPNQNKFATIVNGFAILDDNGHPLGGGQGFRVSWTGVLLVEKPGEYGFYAGAPRPDNEEPNLEQAKHHRWIVILRRGDKVWMVLNHSWAEAREAGSSPLFLRRGTYDIEIRFEQEEPVFKEDRIHHLHTGFQVKYTGPDTDGELIAIPITKLFRPFKEGSLVDGVQVCDSAAAYLSQYFTSTVRDIRRTYQRAFKSVLLAHRFRLSTKTLHSGHQSELGLLLHAEEHFLGTSYYRTSPSNFSTHRAFFDLNFLPATDYYHPPTPPVDSRVNPTLKRQAALFDWWERIFDYCRLRSSLHHREVWMLFNDAAVQQSPVPDHLLQYLDIDIGLARQVFKYYQAPTAIFNINTSMLTDERWAIRVRYAGKWLYELRKRLYTTSKAETTMPSLWASDDPNSVIGNSSGNENLTCFFQEGFDRGNYKQVQKINDGLRERARSALLAYLCDKNRVPLSFGTNACHAQSCRDLSDLLLQDVEIGLAERATRIENAISAVRTFVQRSRLGLELETPTPQFVQMWDTRYATFRLWETSKRREVYKENWIQWEELQEARKSEGFRLLESQLHRSVLTIPNPGGLAWSSQSTIPDTTGLEFLETRERALFNETTESTTSDGVEISQNSNGLSLLGQPELDSQLSWVAPTTNSINNLPLWVKAAVRMGIRFVTVDAATPPPARSKPSRGPHIDKFYFWLADSHYFDTKDAPQDATLGATPPDPSCEWDNPEEFPALLQWKSEPMVHLFWCRVHFGRFENPRRSTKGLPSANPSQLSFLYRESDSLYFAIGAASSPSFRYDMSTDSATPSSSSNFDAASYPTPLQAYPFFIYFELGAPLMPSNYTTAIAVASALRSHCRFEESLKWLELALSPNKVDNNWAQPRTEDSVRNRGVLLEYIEILLQWGESLLGKSQDASVIFNLIEKVLGEPPKRINARESEPTTVNEFKALLPPLNPRLLALYNRIADRRSVHMQCNGPMNDDFSVGHEGSVSCHRRHLYRFTVLLPQALQLVEMVRALGTSLLSAFEKGDAEYLEGLRSTYECQLLELALESKKNQVRESEWQVQGFEQGLNGALCRLNYYTELIQNGLNSDEQGFDTSTEVAIGSYGGATASEAIAAVDSMGPDEYIGSAGLEPVEISHVPSGSKLGQVFSILGRISNLAASIANTTGQQQLTHAEWTRRSADWAQQVDVITIEIQELERQKLAADRRRAISIRELNSHQQQIEQSIDVQNFVRDKFTIHDLYLFLQHETAILYQQSYNLALEAARETQRAFWYEIRSIKRTFLPESAWDNLQEGLLAGERLELALRAMGRAYTEANCREYEITKSISLCMHFPASFLQLKTTGACEIDVPEWMFDLDYPGHFMRRIKSVNLTIPCVSGPYTGIHCRLQLLSSCIRTESYLVDSEPGGYEPLPNDPRFSRQYGATQGIATSNGQMDPGLFQLSFNDERYLPFEFAGAVSHWRIELPPENNQFELQTLADVVMQLNYTAREGGEALRDAATKAVQQRLPANGWRLFDFRQDFASAWSVYQEVRKDKHSLGFSLQFNRSMFPYLTGHRDLYIVSLEFFVEARYAKLGEHLCIKYHSPDCEDEDIQKIVCVCEPDLPGLYHGSLQIRLGPIGFPASKCGTLKFPEHLRDLWEVYMLCRYEVQSRNPSETKHRHHQSAWELDP